MKSGLLIAAVLTSVAAPAFADEPFPKSGEAKLAAYSVCKSLAIVDMGKAGSQSSALCTGIVKNVGGTGALDNLAIQCLEESRARAEGYRFFGSCVKTDAAGDKIYMTYEGPESGPVAILGGTGKYDGITGEGSWTVADAPGNTAQDFAFTLSYTLKWKKP